MKANITSTEKVVTVVVQKPQGPPHEIECRVWEGVTSAGVPFHAFIVRVAVKEGRPSADYAEFERELKEQKKPSLEVAAIPGRMIL